VSDDNSGGGGGNLGPSTDRNNDPVIDPTKNVLDLVAAAITRQDDLREVEKQNRRDVLLLEVVHLKELAHAKNEAFERELALIESRRVEQKIDTKVAVDAALSAAEKAVKEQTLASEKAILKSETSAAEQSKQQNATFTAALKGVTDLLADVKDRVVKVESRKEGSGELGKTLIAVGGLGVALMTILITLALATHGFQ
jgi:hypothetical protein